MASTWLPSLQTGLLANRPSIPDTARNTIAFYFATDVGQLFVYVKNTWNIDEDNNGDGSWAAVTGSIQSDVTATYAVPVLPNQLIYLDAVAGFVATLPTATGSGNVVEFVVKTTLTSGAYEVSVTSGDSIGGTVFQNKTTTPTPYQATIGTTHNVSLTNATVGAGIKGDQLTFTDVAPNVWEVNGQTWITGTTVTPFS